LSNEGDITGEPPIGMSDDEELKRYAEMYGQTVPLGETLVDLGPELAELGLVPEPDSN